MTTFVSRNDNNLGVGRILTSPTMYALYDNVFSLASGGIGAPRIQTAAIQDGAVTAAKLATGTPERDWVLARNAGAGSTVVGAYTIGWNAGATNIARDGGLAGSSIRVRSAAVNSSVFDIISNFSSAFPTAGTTTLAGTWRAMGYCQGRVGAGDNYNWFPTLWLRIS